MTEETPRRPHSHMVGDVGQTEVALVFKRWGWTADEIASDYGEDLDCNIFINHRRTELYFRCQVKSTTKDGQYIRFLKSGNISVSIETSLASFWLTSYYPVLLVIYIDDTREIYWENATQYLRKNLDKLTKKRISIHVNKNNLITQSQANIKKNIQEFYAQILRLVSPQFVCKVIPVLMPEYKILEAEKLYKFESISKVPGLRINTRRLRLDCLPAWTTILSSMNLNFFHCWTFSIKDMDIESFDNKIIEFLESVGNEYKSFLSDGEWLSFICSPIRILDNDNNGGKTFNLNQEITGWWSYCYINQRIKSDFSYAFNLPKNCLMPLPYNGFSWRFDRFVDPVTDLAIEFLGALLHESKRSSP